MACEVARLTQFPLSRTLHISRFQTYHRSPPLYSNTIFTPTIICVCQNARGTCKEGGPRASHSNKDQLHWSWRVERYGFSSINVHCRDEQMIGRELISGGGRGVTSGDGIGRNGVYNHLPACARHDPPIVHFAQIGDVESQPPKTEMRPSFSLIGFSTLTGFILSCLLSILIWFFRLTVWYLRRIVG